MDFIDDNVIKNGFIEEDMKFMLLSSEELLAYSFVGAVLSSTNIMNETECDEDDVADSHFEIDEVLTLYHKLN